MWCSFKKKIKVIPQGPKGQPGGKARAMARSRPLLGGASRATRPLAMVAVLALGGTSLPSPPYSRA